MYTYLPIMSQILTLLALLKASMLIWICCFPSFSRAKQWLFSIRWRLDFTIRPRRENRRPDWLLSAMVDSGVNSSSFNIGVATLSNNKLQLRSRKKPTGMCEEQTCGRLLDEWKSTKSRPTKRLNLFGGPCNAFQCFVKLAQFNKRWKGGWEAL